MLIVDDEAPVREVLRDYFVEQGYTVVDAADGEAALAVFARERPDVVLLDVRMPGLDGLQVLKRLRESDPDVAVIMVTANDDAAVARETLSVGAFDYVAKPFDFEHLSHTVMTAVIHGTRTPPGGERGPSAPADPWNRLVVDVFRAVRGMDAEARASTGRRLEDAALAAVRKVIAGRPAEALPSLIEIRLLAGVASRLGDLSAAGRAVIETALETVDGALPTS
jgi:two-component system response regulator (stage 0 sporulation protein F)